MKKSILATAVALSAGLFASTAMAVLPPIEMTGSTVNFSGNLVPAACEVSVASQNMTIDLGTIDLAILQAESLAIHALTPFDITFENCDTAIATAMDVAFTATQTAAAHVAVNEATDSPADATLVLTAPGAANGVNLDGTLGMGSTVNITDGIVVATYTPGYKGPNGGFVNTATAGNTLFNMTYKVIYQ